MTGHGRHIMAASNKLSGPDFHFRRWTCSILFVFCVYIQCVSADCNGLNITVRTYPIGDIKIRYPGNPLEIFCTAEGNYTSQDLIFTKGEEILTNHTTIINSTTIKLYIEQPEKQLVKYYCSNNVTQKNCVNSVLVDELPPNVTDFKCRSKNLDALRCSWSYPKTHTSISYNITFYVNKRSVKVRTANRTGSTVSCEWTLSTEPQYRQQVEEYNISLIAKNSFGVNEQSFKFNHYAIVIPDKPQGLIVSSIKPHSVVLQWTISRNILDLLRPGVEHKIEYQTAKSKDFYRVNTSSLPPKADIYTFTLHGLPYAYMQYEVRVYIKSRSAIDKDEFWSEFSYQIFETDSEKPSRPPETAAGAFMKTKLNSKRDIFIYWKQLGEYERNGPNFTYQAIIIQDSKTQIRIAEKDKSLGYIDIKDASMSALHIELKSRNDMGLSENSSFLYIPSESNILEGPASFTTLSYQNGTRALYWKLNNIESIDNYTLFWCQYNVSRSCVGRMNFTYLDPWKTSHIVDNLPKNIHYQFAISVNRGIKSSGMLWAKCEIASDFINVYDFPVTLSHDATGKNYVTLSWKMACSVQDDIIIAYNISYCPVVNNSEICDNSVKNASMFIRPDISRINITNLLPYRTYRFDFALVIDQGLREIQNATDYVTTLPDSPQNPVNVSITNVTSNSLIISWDPPKVRNGIIQTYVIYNYNTKIYNMNIDSLTKIERMNVKLENLNAFTNYSLRVQACNSDTLCSNLNESEAIFVRTCIGPPSRLEHPSTSSTPEGVSWNPPKHPAGTVDMYQVRRKKDNITEEIYNTNQLWYPFKFCEGVDDHETFEVRAVNFDKDLYHGALTDSSSVSLTMRSKNDPTIYNGQWSEPISSRCRVRNTFEMTFMFMGLLLVMIGMGYGSLKYYRKYRKMKDIDPKLPPGLIVSEKETGKCTFANWNPSNKEDKSASSDEVLLLPNKTVIPSAEIKQSSICTSANTDSTAVSETSKEPAERQASTSDEGSNSSLRSDIVAVRGHQDNNINEEELSSSDTDNNEEGSPYSTPTVFKKLPNSGYVQHTIPDTKNEYVRSAPAAHEINKNLPLPTSTLPTTSSYVMAGLSPPPIFTTGGAATVGNDHRLPTGYVLPEDTRSHSFMNFPRLGPSPTKTASPESLPTLPVSQPILKPAVDNIQLQSLGVGAPTKPSAGYVSPGDALLHKHLSIVAGAGRTNVGAQPETALSPDAYCRFSWSKDPTTDNLHSWLADVPTLESPDLTEMHS